MGYALAPSLPLGEAVASVAADEVEAALVSLAHLHASGDPAAVHDVRKRTKKLRALAHTLRGTVASSQWRAASKAAAEAARTLAEHRDAEVRLRTLTSLVGDHQAGFADALAHAARLAGRSAAPQAPSGGAGAPNEEAVQHASWLLTGVAAEIGSWVVPDRFASLSEGLAHIYRVGRRQWRAVASAIDAGRDVGAEDLHRWRRSVKYRWYQTRLLEPVAPDLLGAEAALLDELGEVLGVDHDLHVLTRSMAVDPGAWGGSAAVAEVQRLAGDRQGELRGRAGELGRQLYAERVVTYLERRERWWGQTHRRARAAH